MIVPMATTATPPFSSPSEQRQPLKKSIPGSYGFPIIGPMKDRLDYFWFKDQNTFFRSRMESYKSTVFRTNIPPTFPFFFNVDPKVIALLDCSSFTSLFDHSVVEKSNVLVGSYMPSLSFTGGTRVGVYLDTSEPGHANVKNFVVDILKRSSKVWIHSFSRNADQMFEALEADLKQNGSAGLLVPLQKCIFGFLCNSIVGVDPSASPEIESNGYSMLNLWLLLQLLPTTKAGVLPQPLEELLLHSFPFPFFLVSSNYNKLFNFVKTEGQEVIQLANTYGLSEEEAINNILFFLGFNAFGGFSIFFPSLLNTIGKDRSGLQEKLRDEVRTVLNRGRRSIGFDTVNEMELVKSTVHEILRLNPPVPLQFARAKKDFVLNSHDSSFEVKKGELLCGYQTLAMRDPKVFEKPEEFVPERFMDEEGKELLNYLFWSNGPQTGKPSAANKQCVAKDQVVWTACMMIAKIFETYDSFRIDDDSGNLVELSKTTVTASS